VDDFTLIDLSSSWTSEFYAEDTVFQKLSAPKTPTHKSELWVRPSCVLIRVSMSVKGGGALTA